MHLRDRSLIKHRTTMRFFILLLCAYLLFSVSEISAQDLSGFCDVSGVGKVESSDECSSHCGNGFLPCFISDASSNICNSSTSDSGSSDGCYYQEDSVDGEGLCAYQCSSNEDTTFAIYIPYANLSFPNYGGGGDGDLIVSESLISTVGTLEIDSFVWIFKLAGGDTGYVDQRGEVVNVTISGRFLATQTQVTYVTVINLNLTNQVDALAGLLAPTTTTLTLDNNLFLEFPWGLGPAIPDLNALSLDYNYISMVHESTNESYFTSLKSLSLQSNEIQSFDAIFPNLQELALVSNNLTQFPTKIPQMSSLTTLSLSNNFITSVNSSSTSTSLENLYMSMNGLVSFEGYFPNLQSLDLSHNNLSAIPTVVYNCTKLVSLDISNNPLTLDLTAEQLEFLRGIPSLDVGVDGSSSFVNGDCNISSLNGISVCVHDSDSNNDTTTSSETRENHLGAIIGGITGGIAALALIIAAAFYWRRSSTASHSKDFLSLTTPTTGSAPTTLNEGSSDEMPTLATNYSLDPELLKLQVDPRDVQDIRLIGVGSDSLCWLVRYRQTELLASKQLQPDQVTPDRFSRFVHEVKLVASLAHPNIISLVGINWRRGEAGELLPSGLQALFEYAPNGTLHEYLASPAVPKIWHAEKLQVATDVADSLAYLHSLSPTVVHRGVHSHNVLLTSTMRGKLAGFGSAMVKKIAETTSHHWAAPEVMSGNAGTNESADVYSFGILLLELDSHKLPNVSPKQETEECSRLQLLERATSTEFTSTIPPDLKHLALLCLQRDPRKRPPTANIVSALRVVELQY